MTRPRPFAPERRSGGAGGEAGFIIVAVLWILAVLATLASAYALYAGNGAVAARISSDRLQADSLIAAGLELTALQLADRSEENPRRFGEFQFRMGGADVVAHFRAEGARIDLNAAQKDLLAGLFAALGAKAADANSYADRIIAWRTEGVGPGQQKEIGAYKDAGLKYGPRGTPFENVAELRFVLGIPPELVERAMPFVTLFNGSPQVDPIAAPPEIIAALPHIDPHVVQAVLARRDGPDPKAILPLLGPASASVSLEPSKAARINIAIAFRGGRRVEAEAVILMVDKDSEPYRVLAWSNDFDGTF
jgi:general secretion pathway protein K